MFFYGVLLCALESIFSAPSLLKRSSKVADETKDIIQSLSYEVDALVSYEIFKPSTAAV